MNHILHHRCRPFWATVTLGLALACQPNPEASMLEDEAPLAELQAKFAPLEPTATVHIPTVDSDYTSLALKSAALADDLGVLSPSLDIYKIINKKKIHVTSDDIRVTQKGKDFQLSISPAPMIYSFRFLAKDEAGDRIKRRFIMQVGKDGRIRVETTAQVNPQNIFSGSWQPSDQGQYIKWLQHSPVTEEKGEQAHSQPGLLAVKDEHVIWAKASGEVSLGKLTDDGVAWGPSYYNEHGYHNSHAPTDIAFYGKRLFIAAPGSGLRSGMLRGGRITWDAHYREIKSIKSRMNRVSIQGEYIVVGSEDTGFIVGKFDSDGFPHWLKAYDSATLNTGSKPEIHASTIGQLAFAGDRIYWSNGLGGLFTGQLAADGALSQVRPLPSPFSQDLPAGLSAMLVNQSHFFLTDDHGSLAYGLLAGDRLKWLSVQHQGNNNRIGSARATSVAQKGDLVLLAKGNEGLLLGKLTGDAVHWRKRYTKQKRAKLAGDIIWKVAIQQDKVLVLHSQGVSVGELRPWKHWYLTAP